jgi:hypothetical protein
MSQPHLFSWFNKPVDYVAASVAVVAIVGSFFVVKVSYAYLGLATATGLVLGIADAWLYLGKREKGARFITTGFWFFAPIFLQAQYFPEQRGWEKSIGQLQFVMLAGAIAATVVQFKEILTQQKRSANQSTLQTPASVTPAANPRVSPSSGAAHF